jgi:2',3'-cyclic-nucleotide 2'-phosphodiesterase (5'-nucleotidase family)
MLQKYCIYFYFVLSFSTASHLHAQHAVVAFRNYRIEQTVQKDSGIQKMLKPYADSISSSMQEIIGFSLYGLNLKQPESSLGNFISDCMKAMAEKKFNCKIDAAFINQGGIRSAISKGDISVEKIFELMPFDNVIVIQEISGKVLQQFLDKIAERDGWPVSGIKMTIQNKKAIRVFIDEKPLDEQAIYTIANTDYIANGGDDCFMLKNISQINKAYLFRDAIIEFIRLKSKEGQSIDAKTESRIIYAN